MADSGWSKRPSSRRATLPPDWSRRRRSCLQAAGYQCQIRGPHCTGRATDAHHPGDRNDHDHLQAACSACHKPESSAQGGRASGASKRARIAARNRPAERHPFDEET